MLNRVFTFILVLERNELSPNFAVFVSPGVVRCRRRTSRFFKFFELYFDCVSFSTLALITFNVLQHNNTMYLRDLLTTHNRSRNLRSSSQHLLSVGYMRTASSSRCFKHSAAINWNDLPFDIRACDSANVFKRKLKTHLFNIAYAT